MRRAEPRGAASIASGSFARAPFGAALFGAALFAGAPRSSETAGNTPGNRRARKEATFLRGGCRTDDRLTANA
jgi:hypothetical protein